MLKLNGDLDFVVARMVDGCDARLIAFQHLFDEALVVVARPDHPWRRRRPVARARLQSGAWALHPAGMPLRAAFDASFRQAGLEPPAAAVETTSAVAILSLLLQHDMLALLPARVAALFAAHRVVAVLEADLPIDLGPIGILTRRGHPLRKPAARLADSLPRWAG